MSARRRRGRRSRSSPLATTGPLIARDKASLDIFWLKDEAQEESRNLPAPGAIAAEIVEDLRAALEEFETIARAFERSAEHLLPRRHSSNA